MSPAAEVLFGAIARHGQRPALRGNGLELRYDQLDTVIAERGDLLDTLRARRVALALDNGPDWAVWDLALLATDRVCVPLPGFFSPGQQAHVLDSAGIDTLIGDIGETARAMGFKEVSPGIFQRNPGRLPEVPEGTVKITFTSGTTGQPKGVCLDAAAQLAVAQSLAGLSTATQVERHLCVLPLATLLENIAGIYAPLLAGACIDLPGLEEIGLRGASGLDLPRFLHTLNTRRPHSLILLPQLLLALVSAAEHGQPLPDSLRFIAVGGGRVSPQLLERADARGLPVFEGYGLSECASVVCLNTPAARRVGSVGRTLPHAAIRLAEDGEVEVRGPQLLGYLGEAHGAQTWLPTGDLGHLDDGFLVLHGRKKHQFITAFGRNVNPEWVEAELTQQPPIAQAWLYGEALAENVAVIVPRRLDCSDAELAAAITTVNADLPDYARVHRWMRADAPFTPGNGLLTANGRLRRNALQTYYAASLTAAGHLTADGIPAALALAVPLPAPSITPFSACPTEIDA